MRKNKYQLRRQNEQVRLKIVCEVKYNSFFCWQFGKIIEKQREREQEAILLLASETLKAERVKKSERVALKEKRA